MNDLDRWISEVDRMADNNSGAQPGEVKPTWRMLFPNRPARHVYALYLVERTDKPMPLGDWLMDLAISEGYQCTMSQANGMAAELRLNAAWAKAPDRSDPIAISRAADQMEREEHDYLMGQEPDDDPPAMPSLEDALARLAMESPEAARAARNFLEGTDNLRTVWVRFRVSEKENTVIRDAMKAEGYKSVSEYCRAKVLG